LTCAECDTERPTREIVVLGVARTIIGECPNCAEQAEKAFAAENPHALRSLVEQASSVPEKFRNFTVKGHPNPGARRIGLTTLLHAPNPRERLLAIADWRTPTPEDRQRLRAAQKREVSGWKAFGLVGPVGTGKTGLTTAIMREMRNRGIPGHLVSATRLLERITDSFDRSATESKAEIVNPLLATPLLCLDDIDKVSGSRHTVRVLYDLIDSRSKDGLPVIITSNFGLDRLRSDVFSDYAATGEAIVDRLVEMAPSWHELTGPSLRLLTD